MATLTFEVTDEEARRIEARARLEKLTISEYLRRQANAAAPAKPASEESAGAAMENERCEKRQWAPLPNLDYDEDDLVDWDVDFTPPPGPTRMVKIRYTHVGPAPIPDWSGEEI